MKVGTWPARFPGAYWGCTNGLKWPDDERVTLRHHTAKTLAESSRHGESDEPRPTYLSGFRKSETRPKTEGFVSKLQLFPRPLPFFGSIETITRKKLKENASFVCIFICFPLFLSLIFRPLPLLSGPCRFGKATMGVLLCLRAMWRDR